MYVINGGGGVYKNRQRKFEFVHFYVILQQIVLVLKTIFCSCSEQSFIHVDNFNSPSQLAKYLKKLGKGQLKKKKYRVREILRLV